MRSTETLQTRGARPGCHQQLATQTRHGACRVQIQQGPEPDVCRSVTGVSCRTGDRCTWSRDTSADAVPPTAAGSAAAAPALAAEASRERRCCRRCARLLSSRVTLRQEALLLALPTCSVIPPLAISMFVWHINFDTGLLECCRGHLTQLRHGLPACSGSDVNGSGLTLEVDIWPCALEAPIDISCNRRPSADLLATGLAAARAASCRWGPHRPPLVTSSGILD